MLQLEDVEASLNMHLYCPGHLANRWTHITSPKKEQGQRTASDRRLKPRATTMGCLSVNNVMAGAFRCEACSRDVSNLKVKLFDLK